MSSYIVEDHTINRVVSFLEHDRDSSAWTKKQLADLLNHGQQASNEAIGKAMFELNCQAVNERYGENQAKEFRPFDYRFEYKLAERFQALKSLRCWLYQCSEGNVPETELYKIMDDYSNALCYRIVSVMPAYENAEWN